MHPRLPPHAFHAPHAHAHQVKDLLFVLLELYETAKHCIQGGYIVRHVEDETYRQDVRTRHAPRSTAPRRMHHPADVVGAPPRAGAIGTEEGAAPAADGLVLEAVLGRDQEPDSAQGGRDVARPSSATLGLAKAVVSSRGGVRPLLLGRLVVV